MKILQWLKTILQRFRAQSVHYIGGSDVLPPPLSPEEVQKGLEERKKTQPLVKKPYKGVLKRYTDHAESAMKGAGY